MTPRVRQGVLALAALLALAGVCAVAWSPRSGSAARTPEAPTRSPGAPPPAQEAASSPPARVRNVFEFADHAPDVGTSLPPAMIPPPLDPRPVPTPPASPLRLVGFVRRAGVLRAALSLSGNVVVLAAGDEAEGYAVLTVDEDAGVTVRTPDGSEWLLPPPAP